MLISASRFKNSFENFHGLSGKSNFVCLPYGYSLALRTFTEVLKPLYSLRSNGMNACYYIDDTLVVPVSKAECSANEQKYKVLKTPCRPWFQNKFQSQVDPATRLTY